MMVFTGPAARIPAEAPKHADAPYGARGIRAKANRVRARRAISLDPSSTKQRHRSGSPARQSFATLGTLRIVGSVGLPRARRALPLRRRESRPLRRERPLQEGRSAARAKAPGREEEPIRGRFGDRPRTTHNSSARPLYGDFSLAGSCESLPTTEFSTLDAPSAMVALDARDPKRTQRAPKTCAGKPKTRARSTQRAPKNVFLESVRRRASVDEGPGSRGPGRRPRVPAP
jgi:hypothetical protein